tara:strand:+ start:158 stop:334 length:177 start_codon:yes stop_codon:yes gene_type:complete
MEERNICLICGNEINFIEVMGQIIEFCYECEFDESERIDEDNYQMMLDELEVNPYEMG